MTHPAAQNGERFLAVAGASMSLLAIAQVLRSRMGRLGSKAPARGTAELAGTAGGMAAAGRAAKVPARTRQARRCKQREGNAPALGWTPRSNEDAILATAESLVRLGLLKASRS